jgi:hypothetical protein
MKQEGWRKIGNQSITRNRVFIASSANAKIAKVERNQTIVHNKVCRLHVRSASDTVYIKHKKKEDFHLQTRYSAVIRLALT